MTIMFAKLGACRYRARKDDSTGFADSRKSLQSYVFPMSMGIAFIFGNSKS